jgi:Zn-dependent M16 (insulinase) family peptidase
MFKFLSKVKKSIPKYGNYLGYARRNAFSITNVPRGSDKSYEYKVDDVVHGFRIKKIEDIHDFSIKAYTLEHEKTHARYLHLHSQDMNNCFSTVFRTVPTNDIGAPHILEHLTLCGSEKYPVRDPFMNMIKRSLNTYMNAWTGADFTSYPFSTQNEKDFYNLLSVYSDVVFKPALNYHDFLQEGWRYDIANEGTPNAELIHKGIVLNEMKGIYQTPDNLFEEYIQKFMFDKSPYGFNSGGHPNSIVKLSYEELKNFYKKFYHPSNAAFFSYGDLDFSKTLKFLNDNYLSKMEAAKIDSEVPLQIPHDTVVEKKVKSPPEAVNLDPKKQSKFALSFLCNNVVDDQFTAISLHILSYLFFETPNSPFYKALLESGITDGFCPGYGYDMTTKESTFTIGVKNVSSDYGELMKIEKVINDTLHEIAHSGFSADFIESVLHQIEVQAKLPKSDFGISILQSVMTTLNHNGDPTYTLKVTENIAKLRKVLKKEKHFENLIQKYLIDNNHKVRLIMTPDNDYISNEADQEKKSMKKMFKEFKEEEVQKITNDNKALKKRQEELQDLNVLPTLNIEDIPKFGERTVFADHNISGVPVHFTEQPTNGLSFLRIKFRLKDAPSFIRPYLRMFCEFFPKLGTKTIKHDKMFQLLDLYTVNLELNHHTFSKPTDAEETDECLVLSVGCLDKNIENTFNLITDLLLRKMPTS